MYPIPTTRARPDAPHGEGPGRGRLLAGGGRFPRGRPLARAALLLGTVLCFAGPLPAVAQHAPTVTEPPPAVAAAESGAVADRVPAVAAGHDFPLTIRTIMRGPEVVGEAPVGVRWTDDSRWIYFRWRPGGGAWHEERELYRVPAEGGEPERLERDAADSLAVLFAPGDLSPDRALRVSSFEGDLVLVERATMEVRRLTRTEEAERDPRFSGDGSRIFFRRGDNLFALRLEDASVRQLTDIRSGPKPPEEKEPTGHKAFLERQQEELFEHIRIRKAREEEREAERKRREERRPEPLYLEREERVAELEPDPSGRSVLVRLQKSGQGGERTIIPKWVTESGYTERDEVRTKVGDVEGDTRVGLLDVETGAVTWLDLLPDAGDGATGRDSAGAGARDSAGPDSAGRARAGGSRTRDSGAPALATLRLAGWNDAGTHALLFVVPFDFKRWLLYGVERATGRLVLLDSLRDEAWVGGPCFASCVGWIPGTDRAWYVSEATGWAHLYTVRADGSGRRALTRGEWEVRNVEIPEDRARFHLITSEPSPFEEHLYAMEFDGSGRTRITRGAGRFRVTPSPDGRRLAVVYDRANRPPELFVTPATPGIGPEGAEGARAPMEQVTVSPTPEWLAFRWIEPEIVWFPAEDGTRVPARIYRPADLGAEPNGAGVLFVHGAGYLQNVHRRWSNYYREYMFHHLLAASGYTVLDIDYRGSAGYGRDWRTAIYRHMGGKDLSDQVDGARWLAREAGVDPDRIGIYGGSYGGFITLMALFTGGDAFRAGAALRSVTDWAHYNHWYTSRILNLPHEDEEAYRRSSPIYFAEGLRPEQRLLILHGMEDRNVHFQDVVRLAQRLIELGKENWEMAVYPVEDHGFVEPASWTDEYRRIYELFRDTIGAREAAAAATDTGG